VGGQGRLSDLLAALLRSSEHWVEAALQEGALSTAAALLTGGSSKVRGNGAVVVGKMAPHMKGRAKQQAADVGIAKQLLSMTVSLVYLELGAPEAAEAEKVRSARPHASDAFEFDPRRGRRVSHRCMRDVKRSERRQRSAHQSVLPSAFL